MKHLKFLTILLVITVTFHSNADSATGTRLKKKPLPSPVQFWLTSPGSGILFQRLEVNPTFGEEDKTEPILTIDAGHSFQTIDGFGNCLTDGSAMLLNRMSPEARKALLNELFGTNENGIGISYLRISLGASDLSEQPYSYDDIADGTG